MSKFLKDKVVQAKNVYLPEGYVERTPRVVNTLQMFITNRCNKRCVGCFYEPHLKSNNDDMSFKDYKTYVSEYLQQINKVTLLGGEPLMHSRVLDMVRFNQNLGLKTTIYTNGYNLNQFQGFDMTNVKIRVGVTSYRRSQESEYNEKAYVDLKVDNVPFELVFTVSDKNYTDIYPVLYAGIREHSIKDFFISSVVDVSHNVEEGVVTDKDMYYAIVDNVIDKIHNNESLSQSLQNLHISKRGIIKARLHPQQSIKRCRFLNILPSGKKVICPFDIPAEKYVDDYKFGSRECNKLGECLFHKVVISRKLQC